MIHSQEELDGLWQKLKSQLSHQAITLQKESLRENIGLGSRAGNRDVLEPAEMVAR